MPPVDTAGWERAYTTDSSLSVRVPPGYRKDGRNDVWATSPRAADYRRFRLDHARWRPASAGSLPADPSVPEVFDWLPAGDTASKVDDGVYVADHSACREATAGVAALIEAGLLSGGRGGLHDRPAARAIWRLWGRRTIVFDGEARDRRGQEELLAILRTVRVARE